MAISNRQRRMAKKANAPQPAPHEAHEAGLRVIHKPRDTNKPTTERRARGVWADPKRADAKTAAPVDLASDMIGALYMAKKLTTSQEQAARAWQGLREGYVSELGVSGYKSCLAGSSAGHDDSDGNPEAVKAYRSIEKRIGRIASACLIRETEKLSGDKPYDLNVLRNALNVVAAGA
jgi:hypothetical protein